MKIIILTLEGALTITMPIANVIASSNKKPTIGKDQQKMNAITNKEVYDAINTKLEPHQKLAPFTAPADWIVTI